ncbi:MULTISPECIES: TIGR03084 family metal-binding protein [unclassified Amycolatopsis]|uniref:TIGR03084 family metal-binding protein n=1 Tax=unclassified Amycolatopsis TaxID=2618356 RepID=UPI0028759A24|nr:MULTISPECIES: TIGR03084 family metal-binding protein [unclassified Amycolatopsis]MDS0136207.1 TIGR03084 family protein [Amycolatopsis sp. 505]MDS0145722.1 TIGR03084 family protein [Amycolatopsis sp. CM201R]
MTDTTGVIADLTAEAAEVDALVAGLTEAEWDTPTPAPGWTVRHQIAHLAFIFRIAGLSAAQPEAFVAMTKSLSGGFEAAVNAALEDYVHDPAEVLLTRWRAERDAGLKALAAVPGNQLVPWLVNPLPPYVLACAGMMEVFAHGQDVADALGVRRERTDRIRHIAGFSVRVRDFGYEARNLTPPAEEFRFELTAPSGARWAFGPEDAAQRVTGSAEDFCLLVTRRRHRFDLDVRATGTLADQWLDIAQAYRGPAGAGRRPGQFDA